MSPREIDALVAEKVMGGKVMRDCTMNRNPMSVDWPDGETTELPHYSTDIAAAWECISVIVKEGWQIAINVHPGPDPQVNVALFRNTNLRLEQYWASSGRGFGYLLEDICLAALKVKGVEVE